MRFLALLVLLAAFPGPALAQHEHHDPPADPHSGHGAPTQESPSPTESPPADAITGPEHAADAIFKPSEMAAARAEMREEHGGMETGQLMIDRLEALVGQGRDGWGIEAQAWHGGDGDKVWFKAEAEGEFGGDTGTAELQALWSRAISPYFDLQAGLRYDLEPRSRGHLAVGVQGLAPYWFEIDAALFLSEKGDLTARVEAEYDLRLTQRLILQPQAELEVSLQAVPAVRLGSGLASVEAGLRLRYEIEPNLAPYIGIGWERAVGDTARFRRAAGEEADRLRFMFGLRGWF